MTSTQAADNRAHVVPGCRVRITPEMGVPVVGTVESAKWTALDGWHIDLMKDKGQEGVEAGYGRWIEGWEPGTVEVIEEGAR